LVFKWGVFAFDLVVDFAFHGFGFFGVPCVLVFWVFALVGVEFADGFCYGFGVVGCFHVEPDCHFGFPAG